MIPSWIAWIIRRIIERFLQEFKKSHKIPKWVPFRISTSVLSGIYPETPYGIISDILLIISIGMPSGILQDFREIYINCFQASCSFANSSQNAFVWGFHLLRFLQELFLVFLQKFLSGLFLELLLGFLQHFFWDLFHEKDFKAICRNFWKNLWKHTSRNSGTNSWKKLETNS